MLQVNSGFNLCFIAIGKLVKVQISNASLSKRVLNTTVETDYNRSINLRRNSLVLVSS